MLSLQDRNWASFKICELFRPIRGTEKNMASLEDGESPLISARNANNGVKTFVSIPQDRLHEGHTITLNNDGDGGAGLAYYQPMKFALDTHVTDLRPIDSLGSLSRHTMQFVAAAISKQHALFGHGRSISLKRLRLLRVMLPTDMLGEPDWKFMENYIREREAAQIERCREFLMKRIADIERERERVTDAANCLTPLAEKIWQSYRLSSIGDIQSGRDIYASDRMKGDTPYITSGSQNNGIGYFVANINDTFDSGYIALNRNGAVGMAFYHPYPSLMGNDCRKLHVKAADGNPYVGNFIALAISKQSECFSYSRKLGTARAQALRIMLPAADDGQPDYAYMEAYGRNITLGLLKKQLAYITE